MDEIAKRLARLGSRLAKGAEKLHPLTPAQIATLRSAHSAQLEKRMETQGKEDIAKERLQDRERLEDRAKIASKTTSKGKSEGQTQGF